MSLCIYKNICVWALERRRQSVVLGNLSCGSVGAHEEHMGGKRPKAGPAVVTEGFQGHGGHLHILAPQPPPREPESW